MNSTPRRLRTPACAVLVGAALVTTACGTDAESRDAAITAIGDVLYDNSSPGTAAAALQRLLGDEVVLGPGETPGDDDQLVELN